VRPPAFFGGERPVSLRYMTGQGLCGYAICVMRYALWRKSWHKEPHNNTAKPTCRPEHLLLLKRETYIGISVKQHRCAALRWGFRSSSMCRSYKLHFLCYKYLPPKTTPSVSLLCFLRNSVVSKENLCISIVNCMALREALLLDPSLIPIDLPLAGIVEEIG